MMWLGVVLVFLTILIVAGIRYEVNGNKHLHNNPVRAIAPSTPLSWASKQILKEYNALPDMHKQWGDITPMLRALDIKYGSDTDDLYNRLAYRYSPMGSYNRVVDADKVWGHMDTDNEYRVLHHKIEHVQRALVRQKEALDKKAHDDKVAGVAGELADVKELTERLRREVEIIDAATEEACSS